MLPQTRPKFNLFDVHLFGYTGLFCSFSLRYPAKIREGGAQ